jgi:hypothetical protein
MHILVFNKNFYKNRKSKLYFRDRVVVLSDLSCFMNMEEGRAFLRILNLEEVKTHFGTCGPMSSYKSVHAPSFPHISGCLLPCAPKSREKGTNPKGLVPPVWFYIKSISESVRMIIAYYAGLRNENEMSIGCCSYFTAATTVLWQLLAWFSCWNSLAIYCLHSLCVLYFKWLTWLTSYYYFLRRGLHLTWRWRFGSLFWINEICIWRCMMDREIQKLTLPATVAQWAFCGVWRWRSEAQTSPQPAKNTGRVVTPGFKDKSECIEHMCVRIKFHACVDSVYTKTQCKSVKRVLKLYYMTECLKIVT